MNSSFRKIRRIIILLLLFIPLSVAAQSKAEKAQAKAEKKKAKQEQKVQANIKKAEKRHAKIQTKETRKRMKKHKKVANRVNENKPRETFFSAIVQEEKEVISLIMKIIIFSFLFLFTTIVNAQITFVKKYDFGHAEGAGDIVQTSDGGYLLMGGQSVFINHVNLLTMKTDSLGNLDWHKITGSGGEWSQHRMVQLNDSVYYTAGHSNVYTGNPAMRDFLLVKMNQYGDTLWTRTYGGPQGEICNDLKATSDGGLIMTGYTTSFGAGQADVYIIKTDLNGDTLWTQVWGGTETDVPWAIIETLDSGYAITGKTHNFFQGYSSAFLLKVSISGVIQWVKAYENSMPAGYIGRDLIQMPDSGYIIGGYRGKYQSSTQLYMFDANLLRVNSTGDSLWSYSYGGLIEEGIDKIVKKDTNIYTVGVTSSFGNGQYDILMMSVSENGHYNWHRYFGGSDTDEGWNIKNTNDGGFAIVGRTNSNCFGCVYFIKTDSFGCVVPGCHLVGIEEQHANYFFNIYPNPASDFLVIEFVGNTSMVDVEIKLFDIAGKEILFNFNKDKKSHLNTMLITLPEIVSGIYMIQINNLKTGHKQTKKLVINN